MSDEDDKHTRHADALEALAAGQGAPQGETSEPEAPIGPASGLMLLSEDEREETAGADFLQEMAAATEMQESASLGELAAVSGEADDGSLDDIAAASSSVAPSLQPQRTARLQSNVRLADAHAYKRTMIPLLLVVGVLLFVFSGVTLMMLIRGDGDPDAIDSGRTYMQAYGKYFVLVSLPMGAILLMGAWLFLLDVKRPSPNGRR